MKNKIKRILKSTDNDHLISLIKRLTEERDNLDFRLKFATENLNIMSDIHLKEDHPNYQSIARDTLSILDKMEYAFNNRPE